MQTTGLNRNAIDKFYTKPNVVQSCIQYIKQFINVDYEHDVVIEPSAGNGAFINEIQTLAANYLFYDIQPEHTAILKQDYLELNYLELPIPNLYTKYHIIGNPPFGRQSSSVIKFIKHSTKFCDTISFILPKSFKKNSMQKYFPLNFHLLYQCDLDDNSFIVNGSLDAPVPCVFQIWEKKTYDRPNITKLQPYGFSFVKKEDEPDISFRRVGVYAGKIDTNNLQDKSIQSHYFIKIDTDETHDKNDIIHKLQTITFPCNNTVGPKSISKQEIIEEYNKLLYSDT